MIVLTGENAKYFAEFVKDADEKLHKEFCTKDEIKIEVGSALFDLWTYFDEIGG